MSQSKTKNAQLRRFVIMQPDKRLLQQWRGVLTAATEVVRAKPSDQASRIAQQLVDSASEIADFQNGYRDLKQFLIEELSAPTGFVHPSICALLLACQGLDVELYEYDHASKAGAA